MKVRALLAALYAFFVDLLSKDAKGRVELLGGKFDKLADELDSTADRLDKSVDSKISLVQVIAAKAAAENKAAGQARDLAARARLVR